MKKQDTRYKYQNLGQITKELLRSYNLYPKKRLGQNFLIDEEALSRIVNAVELSPSDTVLEIGTGLGTLTSELAKLAKRVITIDNDADMVLIAKEVLKKFDNMEVIQGDILDTRLTSTSSVESLDTRWGEIDKVVGNLPYYITSPIIEKLLCGCAARNVKRITMTVQKEVAQRLAAKPGNRQYGSFTVFVQNRAEASIDSFIPKTAFYPQPDVDSAILILKPFIEPKYKIDHKLVKRAFQQRRKTIANSLKEYNIDFAKLGIDSKRRPETFSLEEFELLSESKPSP